MEVTTTNCNYSPEKIASILEINSKLFEENSHLKTKTTELETNLEDAKKQINWLMEQFKLNKQKEFGRKNESSEHLQLSLIFDEESSDDVVAETVDTDTETITYSRKKKKAGRKIDTSNLPREVINHDLPDAEKSCAQCGTELTKFGEDRSEQLEYIPAQVKVIEHVVPKYKYSCKCSDTVKCATKPDLPIPKSMAAPSLIAEVIIKKYSHHLPWYRQSKIFAQEGIDIPANTICNWYLQAGEVLGPLRQALKSQLNNTNVLQVDETPVKVLEKDIRGYMWCYHSCDPKNRFILFEYNDSRSGKVVGDNLKDYQGILQSDGYSGYNSIRKKAGIINIGCWAHCRRNFADVVKISSKAGKAHEVMKWITKLYQIESEARESDLSCTQRKQFRQERSPPILEKIKELITKSTPPTKSALGKAITYTLNQWEYLIRYIDYGEAEIDNNWIENQIRPFALGRRNWLFIGNEKSANTAAFFYSLIQSCILNDIDTRKYLVYILKQAGKMRREEVDPSSLLPQFIDRTLLA